MLISMLVYRLHNQRACTVVSTWTQQNGSRYLVREVWEPEGPRNGLEVAIIGVRAALANLEAQLEGQDDAGRRGPAGEAAGRRPIR